MAMAAGLCVATLCLPTATRATAAPPPVEAFFGWGELSHAELSPSGRWLAVAVQPPGLRRGLAVYDLHGSEPPRELARFSDIDVGSIDWVGDDHLAFKLLDTQRGSGEQRRGSGLFTVRRDGSGLHQHILMQWWNAGQGTRSSRRLDATHALVHVPSKQTAGAETVIVQGARNAAQPNDWVFKRLNIVTGEVMALNAAEPADVRHWLFDAEGNPRYGLAESMGQNTIFQRGVDSRGLPSREWQPLLRSPTLDKPWSLHSLDLAGNVYVTKRTGSRGESTLHRFDAANAAPAAEPMISVPGFDFRGGLVQEAAAGHDPVLGVRVLADSQTTVWMHAGMRAVQEAVDTRLPGRSNLLLCSRCRDEDRTVVVLSDADRHPGEIWLWRGAAPAPSAWRRIGVNRPAIDPQHMAEVVFTRYAARDGLAIPLWVTLPAGTPDNPQTPAHAVVLVHGGPWVRGSWWGWHSLPQFLASRGYVVLEPEFRGSSGSGDHHYRAGWRQWGRAMQDDLADAVQWAAAQKLVDRQRVCIAGASYGGYAALMGLVRQADVFRCAAAWVPLTDPRWLLREGSPDEGSDEVRSFLLPTLIADRSRDSELRTQISPLEQAARIRQPVLLAWSEEDTRTPPEQAKALLKALRSAGQDPEAVGYAGEGHTWLKTAQPRWTSLSGWKPFWHVRWARSAPRPRPPAEPAEPQQRAQPRKQQRCRSWLRDRGAADLEVVGATGLGQNLRSPSRSSR